jgi:uncharacterized surface protein with fasciclin (FAS1) repeats
MRRQFLKTGLALAATAAGSVVLTACGGSDDPAPVAEAPKNVVQVAQSDPQFSVLVDAVIAADLASTLSGPGPFTVFAPTNEAFTKLLAELKISKEALFMNKPLLTAVLTYHVLGATVEKAGIPVGRAIDPLLTGTSDVFKIDLVGGAPVITDGRNRSAKITATDIQASNGVIHVIDTVILPADKDIVETAVAANTATPPEFTTLVEAVIAAGLVDTLKGAGPFTVFAPTDAAFTAALSELGITKDDLLADKTLLTSILTYHVVAGRFLKADVPVGAAIATVEGKTLTVDATLTITDQLGRKAKIGPTDILTKNGVIHVIDNVILPTSLGG